MPDYIPKVSRKDVVRVIERDYSDQSAQAIFNLLAHYDPEEYHCALHNRIYLAILKMANGDVKRIEHYLEIANGDFRDLLLEAEYPNFNKSKLVYPLSENAKEQLQEKDWKQYCEWLTKP